MSQAIHIKDGVNYSGYNMGGGDATDNFRGTLEEWNNLSPEQQAQYNTRDLIDDFNGTPIDTDLDPTSTYPVQNQAIAKNIEAVVNVYGSKNLLPNTATTQIVNGITFTVNSDGSVTVDGTASANWTNLTLATFVLPAGSYRATGIYNPSVWYNDVRMSIYSVDDSGATINQILSVYDEYLDFTLNQPTNLLINLTVRNKNDTVSNTTFYPMIRDARISDDTYVPYAMTNRELTENAGNWVGLTLTASIGAATIQKNDMLKLAIITWRAGTGTGSGTITLPTGMSVKHATIEGLRKGGYLDAAQNATTITITDAAAYDVGQIIITYK